MAKRRAQPNPDVEIFHGRVGQKTIGAAGAAGLGIVALGGVRIGSLPIAILAVAVTIAMAWIALRIYFASIVATPKGLIVHNYFRTHTVEWGDITGFGPPAPYGKWRDTGLRIERASGEPLFASAWSPGPRTLPGFADADLDRLEMLRRRWALRRSAGG